MTEHEPNYLSLYTDNEEHNHFCLMTDIGEPDVYIPLLSELRNSKEGDEIHLHISSQGGDLISAINIHNAVIDARYNGADVIGHCEGEVVSAATIIAFSCNKIIIEPYCLFLIHDQSTSLDGKVNANIRVLKHYASVFRRLSRDVYKICMSEEEIDDMLNTDDKYFINDKEMIERLMQYGPEGIIV